MRRTGTAATIFSASFLLLAGCSGGKEADAEDDGEDAVATAAAGRMPALPGSRQDGGNSDVGDRQTVKPSNCQTEERIIPPRKEFVIVREIVRQHSLQQGNEKRMEAIEAALKSKFPLLPDKGETEEEKQIYREAEELSRTLAAQ